MEKVEELRKEFEKRNFYTTKDSSLVFLFALFLPFILGFIFVFASQQIALSSGIHFAEGTVYLEELFNHYLAFSIPYTLLTQVSFLVIFFCYNKLNRISFSASKLYIKKTNVWTALLCCFVGIICVFGLFALVENCFGKLFEILHISESSVALPLDNVGMYFLNVLLLGIIPAFSEELIFRGVIFSGLKERFSVGSSIVLSALIFALVHQSILQFFYPFVVGCLLAFVFEKTSNLIYPMLIHLFSNVTTITLQFLVNLNIINLDFKITWWFVLIAIALAVVLVAVLWLIYRFYLKKQPKITEEKRGQTNDTATINVGKMPVSMFLCILVAVAMIVINLLV